MEIKLLDLMVSLWLFSRLVGSLSKPIVWTFFNIYIYIYFFFFDNAPFEKSLNATFISLIPKISGEVSDLSAWLLEN